MSAEKDLKSTGMINQVMTESVQSPFSSETKKNLLKEIATQITQDEQKVREALTQTALGLFTFPSPVHEAIVHLQNLYAQYKDDPEMIKPQQDMMRLLWFKKTDKDIFQKFITLLKNPQADQFQTAMLAFLATQLSIKIPNERLIEGTVHQGKVHWRVIEGEKVIYEHSSKTHNYTLFAPENTWRMSPDVFFGFKNAGKRGGNIVIEKGIFASYFEPANKTHAKMVWDELKAKGILDGKDRLSPLWRSTTNQKIELETILKINDTFNYKKILKCLQDIQIAEKSVSKNSFINAWEKAYQPKADLLWEILKTADYLDISDKLKPEWLPLSSKTTSTKVNPMYDRAKATRMTASEQLWLKGQIDAINISYTKISQTLYSIVDNQTHYLGHQDLPVTQPFRSERGRKTWTNTGRINNDLSDPEKNAVKRFDVGAYQHLSANRNSENEQKENHGKILNYDHIPSKNTLDEKAKELLEKLDLKDPQRDQIKNEQKGHGDGWFTIAILEDLHKQGETFLQSAKAQKNVKTDHALNDIKAYLKIIEKRPEEFGIKGNDYLKALGAFRYLCKVLPTTIVSNALLKESGSKEKLDELFNQKIKAFATKTEGVEIKNIAHKENSDKEDSNKKTTIKSTVDLRKH